MKTNILKLTAIMLLLIVSANSCEREDESTLPPETQEGKNTFGCYVNDTLFVKVKRFSNPTLEAKYSHVIFIEHFEKKKLHVRCKSIHGFMDLIIDNPREGDNILSIGSFIFNNHEFASENSGQVYITKFDTINRIVSGTFEFTGRNAIFHPDTIQYVGDLTAQVKKGRFDVKLNIFD